jgi:hypothetical protein
METPDATRSPRFSGQKEGKNDEMNGKATPRKTTPLIMKNPALNMTQEDPHSPEEDPQESNSGLVQR